MNYATVRCACRAPSCNLYARPDLSFVGSSRLRGRGDFSRYLIVIWRPWWSACLATYMLTHGRIRMAIIPVAAHTYLRVSTRLAACSAAHLCVSHLLLLYLPGLVHERLYLHGRRATFLRGCSVLPSTYLSCARARHQQAGHPFWVAAELHVVWSGRAVLALLCGTRLWRTEEAALTASVKACMRAAC